MGGMITSMKCGVFSITVVLALSALLACQRGTQSASDGFRVDASWPKKPARITWGQMPGVAVDSKDRVWIFTRSTPAVQAYDAATGALVVEWHPPDYGKAHHIKIRMLRRLMVSVFSKPCSLNWRVQLLSRAGWLRFLRKSTLTLRPFLDFCFLAMSFGTNVLAYNSSLP